MGVREGCGRQGQVEQLADFTTRFNWEDVPHGVAQQAKLVLLDTLGVILAASPERYSAARIITEFVQALGGTPESTIVGRDFKTSCVNAALANGTLGYYADMEPFHRGSIVHAAAVVVPSSLAVGERERVDGKRFLAAIVLGTDVACRVSYALDPTALYQRGFHPSAVAGCFGATAAAGNLLGLDVSQFQNAFGLAGTQACGLLAWVSDHTENSRPFNMGIAARNGVTSALLAKMGFGGPPDIFEGKYDLFTAFSGEQHLNELTDGLGTRFSIMEMAFKLYSCVGWLPPGLDGLLSIVDEQELEIEDIAHITLRIAESGVPIIDHNELKSHCAQYILPVALLDRQVVIDDILQDRRTDPRVQALSERVFVVGDAELEKTFPDLRRTIVEVVAKDGKRFVKQVDYPKGYPENPLSQGEVEEKFIDMATSAVSLGQAEKIVGLIKDIEEVANIEELADMLRVGS